MTATDVRAKGRTAFRKFVNDGVESSGANNPDKDEIRLFTDAVADTMEVLESAQPTGGAVFTTKAQADANLNYVANTRAEVFADSTPALNGVYQKQGASGAGSWTKISDLATTLLASQVAALQTQNTSLFGDTFNVLIQDSSLVNVDGRPILFALHASRVWDAARVHDLGVGALVVAAGGAVFGGFNAWFDHPAAVKAGITTGSIFRMGGLVQAAVGVGMGVAAWFIDASQAYVGGQVGAATLVATGGAQVLSTTDLTVPVGAAGVEFYFYNATGAGASGEVLLIDEFGAPGSSLDLLARDRFALAPFVANLRTARNIGPYFPNVSTVTWASRDDTHAATVTSPQTRNGGDGFTGFGLTFNTPGAIAFNALEMLEIRRGTVTDAQKWRRIRAVVRTHATAPDGAGSTLVAVGDVEVDPNKSPLTGVVVPLRDPTTGAVKNITQADLLAKFLVAYQGINAEGTEVVVSDTLGDVAGLASVDTWYFGNSQDARAAAASPYSGDPEMAIGLIQLTTPVVTTALSPSVSLALALGVPAPLLTRPSPREPITTPRWFGVRTYEGNIWNGGLRSGLGPVQFDYAGGSGLGAQMAGRWSWPAALGMTSSGGALTVATMDPEHLAQWATGSFATWVVEPNAAAGAARTGLCIGDSTTNAGAYTARLLSYNVGGALANAGGVQTTLIGTQGAGANKHEGRGGWSFARYYAPTGADIALNPFVDPGAGTPLFDFAYYLSNTGQAAPDWVLWHLGINDCFGMTTDAAVHGLMDRALIQLDAMIASTKAAAPGVACIVATPIPPGVNEDAWGTAYQVAQNLTRYKRNIAIVAYRLAEYYRTKEAQSVYLLPWHTSVDPVAGYSATDPIHPLTTGNYGYNGMGDELYFGVNVLTSLGIIT